MPIISEYTNHIAGIRVVVETIGGEYSVRVQDIDSGEWVDFQRGYSRLEPAEEYARVCAAGR